MTRELVITDNDVPTVVLKAIKKGRKIVAVKQLREATGLGLANAKVVVDRIAMQYANSKPELAARNASTREVSSGPRIMVLTIALLSAYWLWRQYFPV